MEYSRDAPASVMRELGVVYRHIRFLNFKPDETRSGRIVGELSDDEPEEGEPGRASSHTGYVAPATPRGRAPPIEVNALPGF